MRLIPASSGEPELADLDDYRRRSAVARTRHPRSGRGSDPDRRRLGCARAPSPRSVAPPTSVLVVTTPEMPAFSDAYSLIKLLRKQGLERAPHLLVSMAGTAEEAEETAHRIRLVARRFVSFEVRVVGLRALRSGGRPCRTPPGAGGHRVPASRRQPSPIARSPNASGIPCPGARTVQSSARVGEARSLGGAHAPRRHHRFRPPCDPRTASRRVAAARRAARAAAPPVAVTYSKEDLLRRFAPLVRHVVERVAANLPAQRGPRGPVLGRRPGAARRARQVRSGQGRQVRDLRGVAHQGRGARSAARARLGVALDASQGAQPRRRDPASSTRSSAAPPPITSWREAMKMTRGDFYRLLDQVRGAVLVSLDESRSGEDQEPGTLGDHLADPSAVNLEDRLAEEESKIMLLRTLEPAARAGAPGGRALLLRAPDPQGDRARARHLRVACLPGAHPRHDAACACGCRHVAAAA